ncbi:hypothetical protein L7F22_025878 [Adiantum nelumboides]|nr:hypothetical protein [Adiantum nelumboides]
MASPGNVVYAENDRPRMGAIRRSFQKNVLLVKPKLGTTKKPTTDIPDEERIYGVCNEFDEEGVREVLVHKENVSDLEKQRGPDILSMNKLAAIRAWGKVGDQTMLIFFDQGAKANFISLELASKLGIRPKEMGYTAEAGLACPGHLESVTPIIGKLCLHIQSYVDAEEFYMKPLDGCDVLLGIPWMFYAGNNGCLQQENHSTTC